MNRADETVKMEALASYYSLSESLVPLKRKDCLMFQTEAIMKVLILGKDYMRKGKT